MIKLPKIDVVFDRRGRAKDGKNGSVEISVYQDGKRKYVSTGVCVSAGEWDEKWHVVRREDAVQLNAIIDEQLRKCRDMMQDSIYGGVSLPDAKVMKVDRSDASWLDFLRREIEISGISEPTKKHHRTILRQMEEYGKVKRFEDLTRTKIEDFLLWVRKKTIRKVDAYGHDVQEPISQVTVYGYWKTLKKYVRIAQEKRLVPMDALLGVKVAKGRSEERVFLNDAEIERWRDVVLPYPYLKDARDRFLVQMGTGLAFSDMMETDFTKHMVIDGFETLTGKRVKTGEQFFIVILPMAVEVLERWNWQVPKISNQKYNAYLKIVQGLCEIKKEITSHVARHTYATNCLSHGVRMEAVQRTLGHSSIKTTQIYAKMVDMDVVNAFGKMKK